MQKSKNEKLTTTGSSSAMVWMNGQIYFRRVLGAMAPPEPPTVAQVTPSFGYALMKKRAHMR
jgi:hypothetical protein